MEIQSTLVQLVIFLLAGWLTGYLAHLLVVPEARVYDPWGIFILATIGSLAGGFLASQSGLFAIPYVFFGSILLSVLSALLLIFIFGFLIMMIVNPEQNTKE